MKHTMVTFQLHRKGVVLLIVGCVLIGVLLFAGGYLAGMRRAPSASPMAMPTLAMPKVPVVNASAATAPAPARPPEHYAIRAGLFTSNEEATAFLQQLTARKLPASLAPMSTNAGATLYAVRIGDYPTRRAAATAAEALKRDQGIDGVIVSLQMEPMVAQTTT